MPGCGTLLTFAYEQLAGAPTHVVDVHQVVTNPRDAGLTICLHGGQIHFHEGHYKHAWHGSADRAYNAIQVMHQWLSRTQYNGTRCFEHSGRDDQRILSRGRGGSQDLPVLLWHWCYGDREGDSRCRRPSSLGGVGDGSGLGFLWPEHDYEGTIGQHQPPTREMRADIARIARPWKDRSEERLRYRGSAFPSARLAKLMRCSMYDPLGSDFFTRRTDFRTIDWRSKDVAQAESSFNWSRVGLEQWSAHDALPADMQMEQNARYKHLLWLPGAGEWSSSLNRYMAFGATLFMPQDIGRSHSLNSLMLLERCGPCVVPFNYSRFESRMCGSLRNAFEAHQTDAEEIAAQLTRFVAQQLAPDCVDRYMSAILEGLPQTVVNIVVSGIGSVSAHFKYRGSQPDCVLWGVCRREL